MSETSLPPENITEQQRQFVREMITKMLESGTVIQKGFDAFKKSFLPEDLDENTVKVFTLCWYLSAQNLFSAITQIMEQNLDQEKSLDLWQNLTKELDKTGSLIVDVIALRETQSST